MNLSEAYLLNKGASLTAAEISGQPALWNRTAAYFKGIAGEAGRFFWEALRATDETILTGAGTSSFIGLSLEGLFFRRTGHFSRSVPTTDIVSHPEHFFNESHSLFIISFARSGNSPESCAALELADKFSKKCYHLIITCDGEGSLAAYHSANPSHVLVLPPGANDRGLAMTGSYSSMLLVGLLLAFLKEESFCDDQLALGVKIAEKLLHRDHGMFQGIAQLNFKRAVFLGSGGLFGTAQEAALKLQELTDGRIVCKADTYLGFRHGPKAVIDEQTLVTYFFSNNGYVQQYEKDLLHAMKKGNRALFQWGIGERTMNDEGLDEQVILTGGKRSVHEDFLPLTSILPAQLVAFFKSLQLGLLPDAPSASGAISRVVEGVNIYPVEPRISG